MSDDNARMFFVSVVTVFSLIGCFVLSIAIETFLPMILWCACVMGFGIYLMD
jgi:hypothetical protein